MLDFLQSHTFAPSNFALGANSACRLYSQIYRQIAELTVGDVAMQEEGSELRYPVPLSCVSS